MNEMINLNQNEYISEVVASIRKKEKRRKLTAFEYQSLSILLCNLDSVADNVAEAIIVINQVIQTCNVRKEKYGDCKVDGIIRMAQTML